MRTEISARGKIDRESDKGDSHTEGLVRVCGGVRMWLLHFYESSFQFCKN